MSEKVLLVDDEKSFLETLAEQMRSKDMDVATAMSYEAALNMIKTENFNAIVLSLMEPENEGFEAVKAVKKISEKTDIILLTGHATVEKGIKAMKLGALDLLSKSTDIRIMTEKIAKDLMKKMIKVRQAL